MPFSNTWTAAGSCTSNWQHRQAHLPRIWRCTKNCAGTIGQPLADVPADAHHGLAAALGGAGGVLGLDALLHARQVRRQRLALGLAAGFLVWRRGPAAGLRLQGGKLGFQAGLVGGQRLLEDLALLGVHALGLGAELPGLQPRQLEGDALDLRVAPFDRLQLRINALALFNDVLA